MPPEPGRDDHRARRGAQYRAGGVLAKAAPASAPRRGAARQARPLPAARRRAATTIPLTAKAAVLQDEARRVADRRSHLNDALAWSAARWAADQAIAARATVIYVEDLRSMEARGMGRTLNTRLSQAVRGQITERLRHIAAEHGIAVVTVPPRGTSKNCPRCLAPLRHCKAPDQPARARVEVGQVPRLRLAGRPRPRRLAADRRPRPRPPGQVPPPAVTPAPWPSAPSMTGSKHAPSSPPTLPGRDRSKSRPDAPEKHPTPRAQATHGTLPAATPVAAASVRRDTRHRPGPRCPAQHAGTSARARPARPPPGAPTGHAGRHSAPASTSRPRHPAQTGTRPPAPSREHGITEDH